MKSITSVLETTIENIECRNSPESICSSIQTGLFDLDSVIGGLHNSELVVIASRPSMGKTTFAMNIVENVIEKDDCLVAVFSLTMAAEQLVMRMISSIGRIDQTRVRTGQLEQHHWQSVIKASNYLQNKPVYIDDSLSLNPDEIREHISLVSKTNDGIDLIIIDDLQSLTVDDQTDCHRSDSSRIARSLKQLAKDFNCPVIVLSQINRRLENRPNKRPMCTDLQGHGAIENYADLILFIYRDEVYHSNSPDKGKAEIIIAKQRMGLTGTVRVGFDGKHSRFMDICNSDSFTD